MRKIYAIKSISGFFQPCQQMPKLLEKGASYTHFFPPKNLSAFQYFAYLSVY